MNQIRHGENILFPINEIPEQATLVGESKEMVVAHSETGHHHVAELPTATKEHIKMYEFEGKTYLDIPVEAKVKHVKEHEAHKTLPLKAGKYIKLVDMEFDYGLKVSRKVID